MNMRFILLGVLGLICYVCGKSNTKSLTESNGQEIIEIGAPLKDLHPDIEEEPSAEQDDVDNATTTTLQSATTRDARKPAAADTRRKIKDIDRLPEVKTDDDEARIEKELSDMYRDTDYKADSSENITEEKTTLSTILTTAPVTNNTEKSAGRMRDNFKFQPDLNNPQEVEKFRTSVDEISCEKNKLIGVTNIPHSGAYALKAGKILFLGLFLQIQISNLI